jgi:hypothetical protein
MHDVSPVSVAIYMETQHMLAEMSCTLCLARVPHCWFRLCLQYHSVAAAAALLLHYGAAGLYTTLYLVA